MCAFNIFVRHLSFILPKTIIFGIMFTNVSGDFMEKELENLTGTVEEITYYNEDNGYTVMVISNNGEPLTVVGNFPRLAGGEEVRLQGSWVNHPTYGNQFKASLMEQTLPADAAGILRYLSSGIIKGVRESTAVKIVEAFGADSFNVIENDLERLASVKGISRPKTRKIQQEFKRSLIQEKR